MKSGKKTKAEKWKKIERQNICQKIDNFSKDRKKSSVKNIKRYSDKSLVKR